MRITRHTIGEAIDILAVALDENAIGVAVASEACSPASTTQALRRCSPRIAPVTFSTLPDGQEASLTKATS